MGHSLWPCHSGHRSRKSAKFKACLSHNQVLKATYPDPLELIHARSVQSLVLRSSLQNRRRPPCCGRLKQGQLVRTGLSERRTFKSQPQPLPSAQIKELDGNDGVSGKSHKTPPHPTGSSAQSSPHPSPPLPQ